MGFFIKTTKRVYRKKLIDATNMNLSSTDIVNEIHSKLATFIKAGITTKSIEDFIVDIIEKREGVAYFLGYRGYPCAISTSINNEIVYGLPSERCIKDGDLLKVEYGVLKDGVHAYRGWTYPIGDSDPRMIDLCRNASATLRLASNKAITGNKNTDISKVIQKSLTAGGYKPNLNYVGYRIGRQAHMEPSIPCFYKRFKNQGVKLEQGIVIAIIVISHMGSSDIYFNEDGWVPLTKDNSCSVLFSHMVEVGETARIITEA